MFTGLLPTLNHAWLESASITGMLFGAGFLHTRFTAFPRARMELGKFMATTSSMMAPTIPEPQLYATAGCVEICGGPSGFVAFNHFVVSLAGSAKTSFDLQLKEVGQSGCMSITYLPARLPPVMLRSLP